MLHHVQSRHVHGDGLALPTDGSFSGEIHRLPTVIDFTRDLLPILNSFLPDIIASGAVDSITSVFLVAAHGHGDKPIVSFLAIFS